MRVRRIIDISPPSRASSRQAVPDGRRFSHIRKERSRPCRHDQLLAFVLKYDITKHTYLTRHSYFSQSIMRGRTCEVTNSSFVHEGTPVSSGEWCRTGDLSGGKRGYSLRPPATPLCALWAVPGGSWSETTPTNDRRGVCRSWTTPHAPFEIACRDCRGRIESIKASKARLRQLTWEIGVTDWSDWGNGSCH